MFFKETPKEGLSFFKHKFIFQLRKPSRTDRKFDATTTAKSSSEFQPQSTLYIEQCSSTTGNAKKYSPTTTTTIELVPTTLPSTTTTYLCTTATATTVAASSDYK